MTPLACPTAAPTRPPAADRFPTAAPPPVPAPGWVNWFGVVPPLMPGTAAEWNDFYALARAGPQEFWLQIQAAGEATWLARGMPITDLQHLVRYKGLKVAEYGDGTAVTYDDLTGVGGVPGGGKMALRLDLLHLTGSRNLVVHEAVHTWVNFVAPGWDRSDGGLIRLWNGAKAAGLLWDDHSRNFVYEFAAEGMARVLHYRRYGLRAPAYDPVSGLTEDMWAFFSNAADLWGWKTLLP